MARNLAKAGHLVTGWNRTRTHVHDGLDQVTVVDTMADAVRGAECVFLCLTGPTAQMDVVFDEGGLLENVQPGTMVIDATSTAPSLTQNLFEEFASTTPSMSTPRCSAAATRHGTGGSTGCSAARRRNSPAPSRCCGR